jgi:cellulose biosynthesis protein BcsQ
MCVAFGLQGGGTGKTTISFNVAVKMAREGRRVFS